jgi:SAM-dependent methyltransferase
MPDDTTSPMMQMITAYWVSQIVGTLARLGIPDRLVVKPLNADQLASALRCDADAMQRLMRAAEMLRIVKIMADGGYALTALGDTLRANAPGSLRNLAITLTAPGHWLPWARLADAVLEGKRQTGAALGKDIFEYYADNPAEGLAFTGAMADLSALVSGEVARLVDTSDAELVVDVGGASGIIVAALLRKNSALRGVVFDTPQVAGQAREKIADLRLAERCDVIAGDFFKTVPAADIYILKHVIHDWNDEQAARILTNCTRALREGGTVVLIESLLPEDGSSTMAPLMDLNMLVLTPGRERTAKDYAELLRTAGLRVDRRHETESPMQIIEASPRRYFFPVQRRTNRS